jgi:hypothetical protein
MRISKKFEAEMAAIYRVIGKNEVYVGERCVARMYVRHDGTPELRILQGMPRDETVANLIADCPVFCMQNGITKSTYPLLFS